MRQRYSYRMLARILGLWILIPSVAGWGETLHPLGIESQRIANLMSPANIAQYVRERFEVPATTKVGARPVQPSRFPHFYQTVVTVDDGKQIRSDSVFLTDDARCFAAGQIFAIHGASNGDLIRCIREAAAIPSSADVSVGPVTASGLAGFLKSTVTIKAGTRAERGELYISRACRVGILGMLLPFRPDFTAQLIDMRNQPSVGPDRAAVTIVEYADLECQYCALMQKFLESEFLPRYGAKVRLVFKEFPLSFHEWSSTAAIANECAFQIAPSAYFDYRNRIFGDQPNINATNVRERLLNLGMLAGLDRARLNNCLDSKSSLGRVEASRREAEALGINKTPTMVINGRVIPGPSPGTLTTIVDDALAAASTPR